MDVKLSTKFRNDFLGLREFREIFEDAIINIYEGTPPVSADAPVDGTLLVSITKSGAAVSTDEVSTAQEAIITITTHASAEQYFVVINDSEYTYTNTPDLDAVGVAAGIAAMINNANVPVVASSGGTDIVYVRSKYKGASFTISAHGGFIEDNAFSSITGWTDNDTGTGYSTITSIPFIGGTGLNLECTAGTGLAQRSKDIGTISDNFVVIIRSLHYVGSTMASGRYGYISVDLTGLRFTVAFATDGLFVYDGASWNSIGDVVPGTTTGAVWKFVVNGGTPASATVDIYLDDILLAAGVDCSYTGAFTNGMCILSCASSVAASRWYLDYFRLYDNLEYSAAGVANAVADTLRFSEASNGIISKDSATWQGTAVETGTPSYFRITNSSDLGADDTVTKSYPRIQGDIGLANAAMIRTNMSISSGTVQTITTANITMPAG